MDLYHILSFNIEKYFRIPNVRSNLSLTFEALSVIFLNLKVKVVMPATHLFKNEDSFIRSEANS
jgi:hypothetical protein